MKPLLSSSTLLARLSGLGQWSSRSSALLVPTASALAMPPLPASRRSQVVVRVRPKGRGGQGGPGPGGYRRFDDDDGQDPRKEGGNGRGGILGMWQRMGMGRYLVVGWVGFTGIYYYTHLDQVPISGRRRFLAISPEDEEFMARSSLQQVLQQYSAKILPSYHPVHQFVAGVVKRLLPVTGLQNLEWEIRVIADPQKNAFVLPGGKIFVFTGLLEICPDADSLATVLGHEMAHTIARHSSEKLSYAQLFTWSLLAAHYALGIDLTWVQGLIYNFVVNLPRSRMVESEADYIGLQLMAQACFDPAKSVGVWQRFLQMGDKQPPEFISDHPSHESRIVALQKWLPEARMRSEQSDCHRTVDFLHAFGQSWGMKEKDDPFAGGRRGPYGDRVVGFDGSPTAGETLVRTDAAVKEAYKEFESGEGRRRK